MTRALYIGLMLIALPILIGFAVWLVAPAIGAVVDAAATRPAACAGYTPDECAAAVEGW
ncbi:hypothetical protein [Paracoccus sp. (in: a-proteobacteria)]|uniref:hypothetical protein n=1 Tax=Paracoccus sp. TaxID=267 RepID=UPI002899E1EA|nr:hypothetical protein [Paracoccus sp. (in: a-proteobacteria)]